MKTNSFLHHAAPASSTRRILLAAGAVALLAPGLTAAQTYPARPVKLTICHAPGTGPDTIGRIIGQKLGELLKQPVAVDNRAGAGGQIGVQSVAKSQPDGYNLLLGEVGTISIAPAAFPNLPYKPEKELTVLTEVVRSDFILVVPASSKAATVADFVKAAKASGGRINFATFGPGTIGHFGAEILAQQGGFKIEPIHYRSTGDAVTAIVAGDVQAAFVTTALGTAQAKAGTVRALATTASERSKLLPNVPTFAELGMPKVDFASWSAFFVPSGTPAPIVETLSRQLIAAVQAPEVKQKLEDAGFRVLGTSRADADKMVKEEARRWASIVKATGFKGP
jgi:tripartite-type tricarboxylate transporter receptor subunit TctC